MKSILNHKITEVVQEEANGIKHWSDVLDFGLVGFAKSKKLYSTGNPN